MSLDGFSGAEALPEEVLGESAPGAPGSPSLDAKDALIRGGALRLFAFAATVGLSVLSVGVLTRHLGVSRFGQYTTVMSLVAVVQTVTDAGMASIGTREYAVLEEPRRTRTMRTLLSLRLVLTILGIALTIVWSLAAGYDAALLLGALAASLSTIPLVFQHTLSIPLTTDLRLGTLSGLELLRQILLVAGIVVFAVAGLGVLPLLAVPLVANALLIPPTARAVRGRIPLRPSRQAREWRELLRATIAFSLANAVGVIYIYTAQIVTSLVTSHHESGLFAVAFRVFVVAAQIPGILVGLALPVLARAARDDRDRLTYVVQRIFETSLIGGVGIALGLSVGAGFIVAVVAGPDYTAAAPVLALQSVALVATFVTAGWSFALLSLHLYRGLLLANFAALATSVGLTIGLAGAIGARGAALATIGGELVLAVASLCALVRHHSEHRPGTAILGKVGLAAAAGAAAGFLPPLASLPRALLALATYAAIVLILGALPGEFSALLPKRSRS